METIYVLRGKNTNFFKIGRTTQPVIDRVRQLQTGCPFEIEIYQTFQTFWAAETEKMLHSYLSDFRVSGEWFDADPGIIDSVLGTPQLNIFDVTEDHNGLVISVGRVAISSSCKTFGELEGECLRLIRELLAIRDKAQSRRLSGSKNDRPNCY